MTPSRSSRSPGRNCPAFPQNPCRPLGQPRHCTFRPFAACTHDPPTRHCGTSPALSTSSEPSANMFIFRSFHLGSALALKHLHLICVNTCSTKRSQESGSLLATFENLPQSQIMLIDMNLRSIGSWGSWGFGKTIYDTVQLLSGYVVFLFY